MVIFIQKQTKKKLPFGEKKIIKSRLALKPLGSVTISYKSDRVALIDLKTQR